MSSAVELFAPPPLPVVSRWRVTLRVSLAGEPAHVSLVDVEARSEAGALAAAIDQKYGRASRSFKTLSAVAITRVTK